MVLQKTLNCMLLRLNVIRRHLTFVTCLRLFRLLSLSLCVPGSADLWGKWRMANESSIHQHLNLWCSKWLLKESRLKKSGRWAYRNWVTSRRAWVIQNPNGRYPSSRCCATVVTQRVITAAAEGPTTPWSIKTSSNVLNVGDRAPRVLRRRETPKDCAEGPLPSHSGGHWAKRWQHRERKSSTNWFCRSFLLHLKKESCPCNRNWFFGDYSRLSSFRTSLRLVRYNSPPIQGSWPWLMVVSCLLEES